LITRAMPHHRRAKDIGGPEGNEQLTAMTGAVLLIGFAVEGATILALRQLLVLHFVVGMLLIGPVALKVASTGYRFLRYYAGAVPYVRKGPPAPLLRALGPLVVCTSLAVLATGVMLAVAGPHRGGWLFWHKASFVLWFGVMTVHVAAYAPRLPGLLLRGRGRARKPATAVPGRLARWMLLAASVAAGVLVAAVTFHLSARWGTGR